MDSTTLKYSKMVNKDAVKGSDDDDDEIPMQQRAYDMPSSSDEDSDEDDAEDDAEDDEEEEEEEDEAPVPVKPKQKLPQFAEINVDDI